ncbi:DUF2933 domain-containing protein [Polaromonas sp.]|uniref:DUF2933 domain-containing protein n=1 Tax=Polaromonas sp. TaxID=1869339 RepID=UPI003524F646
MEHESSQGQQPGQMTPPPFWRSRYGIGLIVFGAVAAYFLLTEHRAHFFGALPFLLLLACPLMHVFMHGGHGGGHAGHHGGNKPDSNHPVVQPESPTREQP